MSDVTTSRTWSVCDRYCVYFYVVLAFFSWGAGRHHSTAILIDSTASLLSYNCSHLLPGQEDRVVVCRFQWMTWYHTSNYKLICEARHVSSTFHFDFFHWHLNFFFLNSCNLTCMELSGPFHSIRWSSRTSVIKLFLKNAVCVYILKLWAKYGARICHKLLLTLQ